MIFLHFESRTWLIIAWKLKVLCLGTHLSNDAWIEGKKTMRTKLAWAMQEDLVNRKKIKQTTQVRDLNSFPGPFTSFTRTGAGTKSSGLWLAAYEMGMMSSSLPDAGGWMQTCQQCSCPALCTLPSFFDKVASESMLLQTSSFFSKGALPMITSYIFR